MNKNILAVALSGFALLASSGAMAADGKITFTGTVTAKTCGIDGGDAGSTAGNIKVDMGSVGLPSFGGNTPIAKKDFTLKLTGATGGCSASGKVGRITIEKANVATSGNIKNSTATGAAQGVEVQLSMGGKVLNLNTQTIDFPTMSSGNEQVTVSAALISPTGSTATAGEINAVASYNINFN